MLNLYHVTPVSGARSVPVLARDMKSAVRQARTEFRATAKLKSTKVSEVKVGDKLTRPVIANKGIELAYRREVQRMIADMHNSVQYWLTAGYRKYPPRMERVVDIAEDAAPHSPSEKIKRILEALAKRWTARFDDSAEKIAKAYIRGQFKATDSAFRQALKDAGWTVDFKMTPAVRDALNASLQENVGLIRSIPEKYLQEVQGVVMRSYSAGRDLETMVSDIKKLYPKAADRAVIIARDQCNKANAVVNRARCLELGLKVGIWMHSSAGKVPRPSHVKAGKDKLEFEIAKGALIDGAYILPGQLINCRCSYRVKLPI